jgi:signal transduction histidine kinase
MRSLFLKIFLWFWITLLLVIFAVALAITLQPDTVSARWRSMVADSLSLYGSYAAQAAEQQGPDAAKRIFDRLHSHTNVNVFLLDTSLTPVAGKTITDEEHQLAASALSTREPQLLIKPTLAIGAEIVVSASGKQYVVVAELPRAPVPALRGAFGMRGTTNEIIARLLLALIVSGAICYLLTRHLTGPILRLRTASSEIASGDLSARAAPALTRRRDELGSLVRDFNIMAERIESLVRSQQQLIRDISHELRSPLARLNVALGLARQRSPEEARAALDRIERESERLNEMIGRLLTLARLQGATDPPARTTVSLRALLDEVVSDARFEAAQNQCDVKFRVQDDCTVEGSPELLHSAFENVIRNAVRYTAPHTAVEITMECRRPRPLSGNNGKNGDGPATAVIRVHDHGRGVPSSELENLFRPFYRVTEARERESGGTGIGLAITDGAVRLHGGRVRAFNDPSGGLTVEITLPATAVAPEPVTV